MNSFNHYAFGSVVAWVYRYVAGIDTSTAGPGFRDIVIRPRLDARLTAARGEYESVHGKIVSDWSGTVRGPFNLTLTVPPNTRAKVYLPAIAGARLTESGKPLEARTADGASLVEVGSGSYLFELK
jgi:alpha-L-rhamnosidase